ncbi:MAG: diguanylate cyclase [Anaerolineaceae bacterium]|nr:diguanylate cyclase [Anaerolineaceae bacterium]
MHFQFPGFTIAYVVSAALCFLSARIIWERRVNPGSIPFVLLMISLAVWSSASVFEAGAVTAADKIFWSKWQYLGIVAIPPLWLLFTAQYTENDKFLNKTVRWLIWIIPVVTLMLVLTNDLHKLIWTRVYVLHENFNIGYYEHGIGFFVQAAYSYICLLIGVVWLVRDMLSSQKRRRLQSIIFIISLIIAWSANILYILRLIPISGFDVTPLSFSLVALVMAWSILRFRIFNLVPIARDTLLSSMLEGVIVVDANDVILEINSAALDITGYDGQPAVGRSVWKVLGKYGELINSFKEKDNFHTQLTLPGEKQKTIDVEINSIDKKGGEASGKLIVLRDVTKQKEVEEIEKSQREFAEALADTAAAINSSLNQDEVMERILQNVTKVVPHEAANIALMTDRGTAKFVKVKNPKKYGSMDFLTSLDLNILEMKNFTKMAKSRKPLIITDTRTDKDWILNLERSDWIRSYLGAPIIHKEQLLGFINLDSGEPNFFSREQADRLEIFANYAATALVNAKLYSDTRMYADEMAILYKIGLAIAAGVGFEKTTQSIFRQLKRVIPGDLFFLALYEPKDELVSYFMYRKNGKRINIEPFSLMERPSLTRYVIQKKETVYIPDFKAEDSEVKEGDVIKVPGFDNRSLLGIPLVMRDKVAGVLSVQSAQPSAYSSNHIRLVETIAQQAAVAMDNARLFERMRKMAITDSLTGLYNRRHFFKILNDEIERSKRYQSALSLVMIDIDYFKRVNDSLGHLSGDQLLQSVAEICKKLLRQSDNMFRYGGEEFMIILPETNRDEAVSVANRIRTLIEGTDFVTYKGKVNITISMGVSEYGKDFTSPNMFIDSVDKALYLAKQSGRNRVCLFTEL